MISLHHGCILKLNILSMPPQCVLQRRPAQRSCQMLSVHVTSWSTRAHSIGSAATTYVHARTERSASVPPWPPTQRPVLPEECCSAGDPRPSVVTATLSPFTADDWHSLENLHDQSNVWTFSSISFTFATFTTADRFWIHQIHKMYVTMLQRKLQ